MVRHYPTPGQGQLHHLAQRDGLEIKQLACSLIKGSCGWNTRVTGYLKSDMVYTFKMTF
jgi:hypothetical protein